MPYDLDRLQSDIAQVQHDNAGFGTGRLIADNLILTAAHTLWNTDDKTGPYEAGWQVRLAKNRKATDWPWRLGNRVVWHSRERDLALIEIVNPPEQVLKPALKLRVATVTTNERREVEARGYPRASKADDAPRSLIPASGFLVGADPTQPLRFGIEQADLPNDPREGWPGMSGSAVISRDSQDFETLWVYGVVRDIPPHFDRVLTVAPLAECWNDTGFRARLVDARAPNENADDPTTEAFTMWRLYLCDQMNALKADVEAICPDLAPVASPLLPHVDRLIHGKPWNERVRVAFGKAIGQPQVVGRDLPAAVDALFRSGQERGERIDFVANFADVAAEVRRTAEMLIREAATLRRKFADRATGDAGSHWVEVLGQLIRRLQRFTDYWLDKAAFGRCLTVLGAFGSGRTFLLLSLIRRTLEAPPSEATAWVLVLGHPETDLEAVDWVLQTAERATRRAWADLAALDRHMVQRDRRAVFVIDDFERLVRQRPDVAASISRLVAATTNLTSLRWVFLALDTSYVALSEFTSFFNRYGIAPYEPDEWEKVRLTASYFINGAFIVDTLNRDEEVGLTLIRENRAESDLWRQTLQNIAPSTLSRLSTPLIAAVAIAVEGNTGALPSLHFIEFIGQLWRLRACRRLPGFSEARIQAIMLGLCRLVLEKRTITPSVADAGDQLRKLASATGDDELELLAQLSLIRLPATIPLAPRDDSATIDLNFDIIWHNMMAVLMVDMLRESGDAESHVSSWLAAIPEQSFREGTWQLFLLYTDRGSSSGHPGWWEFALRGLQAEPNTGPSEPGIPLEAALFAGVHAKEDTARYVSGRLLATRGPRREKREVFAVLYFTFSASGVRLANRCKIAARHAGEIAGFGLESYLRFQLARVVADEDDLPTLFAGLRALSGVEVLSNCSFVTETICGRITDIVADNLQGRDRSKLLHRMVELVIDYLSNETRNAQDEYERVGKEKPSGVPYFVREHALHFFLDYMLDSQASAFDAFDAIDEANWYDGTRLGLHPRVAAEMRREVNLAFGRWYRGTPRSANSYRELIRSLVKEGVAGNSNRGEIAYFLLRHTAVPRDHYHDESEWRGRDLVIDPEFERDLAQLKTCDALSDLFRKYPIQIHGKK